MKKNTCSTLEASLDASFSDPIQERCYVTNRVYREAVHEDCFFLIFIAPLHQALAVSARDARVSRLAYTHGRCPCWHCHASKRQSLLDRCTWRRPFEPTHHALTCGAVAQSKRQARQDRREARKCVPLPRLLAQHELAYQEDS